MKFRWDKKYLYWGITALLVVGAGICLFFLMFRGANIKEGILRLFFVLTPVVDGLVLAYLLTPILNWLEKTILKLLKKKRTDLSQKQAKYLRMGTVVLTLVFVAFIVYAFCSMVLPQLFRSIQSIVLQFPVYVNNLSAWLTKVLSDNPQVETYLMDVIDTYTPELREWLNGTLLPQMNQAIRIVSGYAFSIVRALWNLLIGLIISVYIMGSKEKFIAQSKKVIYSLLEIRKANELVDDLRFVHRTFGGFISGKLMDSLIIGLLCFAGTNLIGTPYPVLISVIIGVTNIIPFFGPYLGAIPSALLILMIDPIQCLYFLIFIFILQQFDGNILGPRILGNSTGLSGFWVIFSITIFGGFFGVPGMVIGVPTFAVIYAMIRRRVNRGLKKKHLPIGTDEYKNLVRINERDLSFIVPAEARAAEQAKNESVHDSSKADAAPEKKEQ